MKFNSNLIIKVKLFNESMMFREYMYICKLYDI